MKRKKYNQRGVWACATCWLEFKDWYTHVPCGDDKIFFDSQAEYVVARFLKDKERAGLLTDLKHHPRIEVVPAIYYYPGRNVFGGDLDNLEYDPFLNKRIQVLKPDIYEADFSFQKDGKTHYIEVKSVDRFNQPFIPNAAKLRQKFERIKAIHGIEVEIWTGNIRWHFIGKKLEIIDAGN